jgi:hypothetical protein
MIRKKLLALGLATVMTLSSSVVAFAADADINNLSADASDYGKGVHVTSTTQEPTISVMVPTDSSFILNPYRLAAEAQTAGTNGESDAVATTVNSAIIAPVYNIQSQSNVDLKVSVAVSNVETSSSDVLLSAGSIASTVTTKSAFVYLDFKSDTQGWGQIVTKNKAGVVTATSYADGSDTGTTSKYNKASGTQLVLSTTKNAKTGVDTPLKLTDFITIPAVTSTTATQKISYSYFGEVCSTPATAWAAGDSISCKIRFTFTPVANAD